MFEAGFSVTENCVRAFCHYSVISMRLGGLQGPGLLTSPGQELPEGGSCAPPLRPVRSAPCRRNLCLLRQPGAQLALPTWPRPAQPVFRRPPPVSHFMMEGWGPTSLSRHLAQCGLFPGAPSWGFSLQESITSIISQTGAIRGHLLSPQQLEPKGIHPLAPGSTAHGPAKSSLQRRPRAHAWTRPRAGQRIGRLACPWPHPEGTKRSPHCPTDTALDPHFGVPFPGLTDQLRGLCESPLRSAPEPPSPPWPCPPYSAVWESPSAERKCHPGHPSPRGLLQRMDQAVVRGPRLLPSWEASLPAPQAGGPHRRGRRLDCQDGTQGPCRLLVSWVFLMHWTQIFLNSNPASDIYENTKCL